MPFLNRLQRWAREQPERTAVGVGADRVTFAQLLDRAAALLPETGSVTTLCGANSVGLVAAFAAAVAGERQCAVLDPKWTAAQRTAVEALVRNIPLDGGDGPCGGGAGLADGRPESAFLIGLTSGTSTVPKGFSRTRESWQASFERSTDFFGLSPAEVTFAPGPLSASLNLYALAECLYAGAPFVTLPAFDLAGALRTVREDAVTRLVVVPAVLRMMAERAAPGSGAGVTSVISAGAKLDSRTLAAARRWAPAATIFEYYGASELGFLAATRLDPGDPDAEPRTAVGRAFPGVELSIRNGRGAELARGQTGTIHARSPLVSSGYLWGDDGLAFTRHGDWCTVGDQGFLAADGMLHFQGRRSDMMVSAGHNVYPQEIELAVQGVPGVAACVVVGLPDGSRGHRVVAAVLMAGMDMGRDGGGTASSNAPALAGLRRRAAQSLPEYKRPAAYFALAELPLTPAGKTSRSLLARWIDQEDPRVRRLS